MHTLKTKIFPFLIIVIAFVSPTFAVLFIEHARQITKAKSERQDIELAQVEAERARYEYLTVVENQKKSMEQVMSESRTQYEQLLKNQPELIKDNQTTTTRTVMKPIVTQKIVEQPVAPTIKSKPKSSSTTKSS
ncbi:MAG: hypothetical protein ACSLEX_01510 [Minisyncoccota bacterium]